MARDTDLPGSGLEPVRATDFLNLPEGKRWWEYSPSDLASIVNARKLATGVIGSIIVWFFATLIGIVEGVFGALEFAVDNTAGAIQAIILTVANAAISPMLSAVGVAQAQLVGRGLAAIIIGAGIALSTLLVINVVIRMFLGGE